MSSISSLFRTNPVVGQYVQEESNVHKVLAFVPIVGAIVSFIEQASLSQKISQISQLSPPRRGMTIALISVLNKYKMCDMARNVMMAALTVSLVAAKILTAPYLLLGIVFFGFAMHASGEYHKNKERIEVLQAVERAVAPLREVFNNNVAQG